MGTWNYRVVRRRGSENWLALHEVYYDDEGRERAMTEEPCSFVCEEEDGQSGIVDALRMALKDAEQSPVFDEPEEGKWPGREAESVEDRARAMLDRMGVRRALSLTNADVVELANLLNAVEALRRDDEGRDEGPDQSEQGAEG